MTNKKLVLKSLLEDPLFWSVLLLNLLIVYLYGSDTIYNYNIIIAQSIQTFAYAVAHYILIKNTPINYAVKTVNAKDQIKTGSHLEPILKKMKQAVLPIPPYSLFFYAF